MTAPLTLVLALMKTIVSKWLGFDDSAKIGHFHHSFDSSDSIRTCTSVSPNPNRDTPKAPESGLQYTRERTFAVPSTSAEKEIRTYYGTLYRVWGAQHWWPAETQFERSEEHTSELQSPCNLVCRLLLEKKNRTP